jgi:hypothetical protein
MAFCDYKGNKIPLNSDNSSALAGTTQRFQVTVNCTRLKADDTSTDITPTDSYSEDVDNGFIMLPESYTDYGKKTRLVISCHGAGGTVSTDDSQVEQQTLTKYLVANGYAVMDMNGLPEAFAGAENINIQNNLGSPIAMQCYIKGYHYCMEHFNLYPEVFLMGASMGGISSTNLCLTGSIPVIAQAGWCPVLDTYNEAFLNPWSGGIAKVALGRLYQLETEGNGFIYDHSFIYDENKICGYNPVKNKTVVIDGVTYTNYPVPVKFWHCVNDTVVSYEVTKNFVQSIKNAGGIAYLRSFETGGHEPQAVGSAITNPVGNATYKGETLIIRPAIEEVFLWFKRFD